MKKDPIRPYLIASAIAGIPFIFICLTAMIDIEFLTSVDQVIGQHFYHWGNDIFTYFIQNFTLLGNAQGIIPTAIIIGGLFYYISRRWQVFIWPIFTILVGVGPAVDLIKYIVQRPRPSYIAHLIDQGGYSFPSGHSAGAVMVWGSLAFLIWHYYGDKYPKLAPYLIGFVTFMMVALGSSRLYLGVHYPSDVIAGWSLGGVWLGLCICYFKLFVPSQPKLAKEPGKAKLTEK
ncbi:phosphatase PAP2 family protein [Aerococcus viridans]